MEKYDLVVWGSLAGIVGAATFSILWGLAILTDGHWLFGVETLSELGGFRPGRDLFNSGVTVMGILALPFSVAIYRWLGRELVGKVSTWIFAWSAIFLVGIGVFPINTGTPHTFFSWAFFSAAILSLTGMLHPLWYLEKVSLSFVTTIGVVMTGYVTIALVALEVMELALSEALVVIALVIWVLLLGSTMLLGRPRTSSASSTTRGNDS